MDKLRAAALSGALLGALLTSSACDKTPTGAQGDAGIKLLAGGTASDTIDALIPQALVVEVRGEQGLAAQGTLVRFEVQPHADTTRRSETTIQVCALRALCGPQGVVTQVTDTVDQRGQVSVLLRIGRVAGRAVVRITVPQLGIVDSAVFESRPGNPVRVHPARAGVSAFIGSVASLRPSIVDRYGNEAAGTFTYTLGTGSAVTLDATAGTVTGREFGSQWVYVSRGTFSDSVNVRAIPAGRFVAWLTSDRTIRMLDLNGSNERLLATGISSEFGAYPRFSANRQHVSFHVANQLPNGPSLTRGLLDTAGAVRSDANLSSVLSKIIVTRYMADGSTMLIATRTATGNVWLWRMSDNNVATPVAEIPGFVSSYGGADISPDGTRVAFTTEGRLWVFTVASGALLRTIEFSASFPRWSPQGDRIAYIGSDNSMHGSPVIINGDGTDRRPLGTQLFSAGLAWSPDGTYLLGRSYYHPIGSLRIVRISDAKDVVLTYFNAAGTHVDYYQPDWR